MDKIYSVCLSKKNIIRLIDAIRDDIRLSERAIPKCVSMIESIMKKNIDKLSREPRSHDELIAMIKYLNDLCIKTIVEIIEKKYPDLYINKKRHVSKEQLRRNLDVYGERENRVSDRPYARTRRGYDDDEAFNNQRPPPERGYDSSNNFGNYASAFDNHLITDGLPVRNDFNQGQQHQQQEEGSSLDKRYQQYMNDRNQGMNQQRPVTPDFTLDGSGDRVRREKMLRQQQMDNQSNNMNNNCGMSGSMMNDPYASLLGEGAPNSFASMNMMGSGASSSNNMMMNNDYNMDNQSVRNTQFKNDFERKMMERNRIDIETSQPPQKTGYMNQQQQQRTNYGSYQQGSGAMFE